MGKKSKKEGKEPKKPSGDAQTLGNIVAGFMVIPALLLGYTTLSFIAGELAPPPPPPPTAPTPPPPPPWDPADAPHVVMLDGDTFEKQISSTDTLVMFYAPWCGHCKAAKPELAAAAEELADVEGAVALGALDCTDGMNAAVCMQYDVKGYPTIIYFKDGKMAYTYTEGRQKNDFTKFAQEPKMPPPPPPPPKPWNEESGPLITHLKDLKNFNRHLSKKERTLVMFYAPWCGHCKAAKPEFVEAAESLADKTEYSFAGVDCTVPSAQKLCNKYDVKGYPTIKYFESGYSKKNAAKIDYGAGRKAADFAAFMQDPKPPPPPPPPPKPWAEEAPMIAHLNADTFDSHMETVPHSLVMFYAPWCGHCKSAKPEFQEATESFDNDSGVSFAGVDCTEEMNRDLCEKYEIKGFPTIKYFGKDAESPEEYEGGRKADDFASFMKAKV